VWDKIAWVRGWPSGLTQCRIYRRGGGDAHPTSSSPAPP
jgi:hypothetical protein